MKQLIISIFILGFLSIESNAQENYIYRKGLAFLSQKEFALAEKLFDSVIAGNPSNVKIVLNRGIACFYQSEYTKAEIDFISAAKSGNSLGYFWLAKIFAEQLKPGYSIKYLKQYLSNSVVPDPYKIFRDESLKKIYSSDEWQDFISNFQPDKIQTINNSIEQYLSKQNYLSAHQQIEQALITNPESAILYALNSEVYAKEGNLQLARSEIKKAVELEPENVDYIDKFAEFCYASGNFNIAYEYFQKAKELAPEKFEIELKLSRTCLQLKKTEEAKDLALDFLEFFPEDTSAIYLTAQVYFELQDYNETLKLTNALLQKHKPKAQWFRLRGMTYFTTGTYKYAAYDLSMSLDLEPNNKDANYFMGLAEFEKGNQKLACYYWQRALKLGDKRAFDKLSTGCGFEK